MAGETSPIAQVKQGLLDRNIFSSQAGVGLVWQT